MSDLFREVIQDFRGGHVSVALVLQLPLRKSCSDIFRVCLMGDNVMHDAKRHSGTVATLFKAIQTVETSSAGIAGSRRALPMDRRLTDSVDRFAIQATYCLEQIHRYVTYLGLLCTFLSHSNLHPLKIEHYTP